MARRKKTAKKPRNGVVGSGSKPAVDNEKGGAAAAVEEVATINPCDGAPPVEDVDDGEADVIWVAPPPPPPSSKRKRAAQDVEWELVSSRPIKSAKEVEEMKGEEKTSKASPAAARKRRAAAK